MKHPTLSRIMAILLTLISLSALVSGFYGLHKAEKDKSREDNELYELRDTAEEYRTVLALLSDRESYDSLKESLEKLQEEQDSESAAHRQDLASYTATRGGVESGVEALQQAQEALDEGNALFQNAAAQFLAQEEAFKKIYESAMEGKAQLEQSLPLLSSAETALGAIENLIGSLRSIGNIMDLSGENPDENGEAMRKAALEAYDAMLSSWSAAENVVNALQDQELPVSMLRQAMEAAGLDPSGLPASGSIAIFTSVQVAEFKSSLENALGMTTEQFRSKIKSERDAVASGGGEFELNEEQFGTVRQAYTDNRDAIMRYADMLEAQLPSLKAMLKSAKDQISAAQKAFEELEKAKKAIEDGRRALEEAGSQIWQGQQAINQGSNMLAEQQGKLDEQEEELERRKQSLDEGEEQIAELTEQAEEQKKLEERERSLRLSLLARPEIKGPYQDGEELLAATENWIYHLGEETQHIWEGRFWSGVLMMLCFCFAALTVPSAFRTSGEAAVCLGMGLCSLLCAGMAFAFLLGVGRGVSWSALTTGLAALLLTATFL